MIVEIVYTAAGCQREQGADFVGSPAGVGGKDHSGLSVLRRKVTEKHVKAA